MNGNQSYSLKNIIALLLSNIWLILLITVIGGAAGFSVSRFYLPTKYSSHITMYVQSYKVSDSAEDAENNLSNSKQLVNTYIEVMKDDAVMTEVGEMLKEQFDDAVLSECFSSISPGSIRSCLNITKVTDTSAVQISATANNAQVAAAICNNLTTAAPEYVEKAVGVGSIKTIDVAKVYNSPVSPDIPKNTLVGAAAGLVLIVLILFLIDFFDNTIKDSDALAETFKKPIIGEIQQFGEGKKKNKDANDHFKLTDKEVPFYIVESYKSIRTNVTFSLSTAEKKIMVISSPSPGEGKSTTSANIAIAMAQGGNKVLLIDGDMRKSVQHKVFGIKNKFGLSTAISKMKPLDDCIQKNVMENLDILTGGPTPPNPSELLASESMTEILDILSKQYSVIIIDTPPINVVTDAMELAKNISGIVMIVKYAVTTDEDIDDAVKKIEFAKMNMLGFILNDIKHRHGGGYYSRYRYKYKYSGKYYYKKGYGYSKGYGYGYGYGNKPELEPEDSDAQESAAPLEAMSAPDTVDEKREMNEAAHTEADNENSTANTEAVTNPEALQDSISDDDSYYEIKF